MVAVGDSSNFICAKYKNEARKHKRAKLGMNLS